VLRVSPHLAGISTETPNTAPLATPARPSEQILQNTSACPSLEGRFNFLSGTYVSEHTKLVGFTVGSESLKRFHMHPYADFLIGDGTIKFNTTATGYTSDDSTVYDFGGGLDIDLVHNFQLRGDYQYQHWKLGQATAPFTPNLFLIGVNYQFHFRDYNRQSDR
jgi:hypothetical protein